MVGPSPFSSIRFEHRPGAQDTPGDGSSTRPPLPGAHVAPTLCAARQIEATGTGLPQILLSPGPRHMG